MISPLSRRWRLNPACLFHWRHWDQEYILFNAASGQTHFLNTLGADVLDWLGREPLYASELEQRLATQHNLTQDNDLRDFLADLLTSLDELGLIEPDSS